MRYRALAKLRGVAKNVLALCVFEHRTFHCRNGYIVAVDLAVIVDSVAAYEGTVNTDTVKEIVGLVSDDGSGRAADYAAADVNIERSAVGEEVSSLHGVCVYSSRVHVVKKVAERIHRCSAASDMESPS